MMKGGNATSHGYEGGCQCGALRYRVAGDPVSVGICRCRECQRPERARLDCQQAAVDRIASGHPSLREAAVLIAGAGYVEYAPIQAAGAEFHIYRFQRE